MIVRRCVVPAAAAFALVLCLGAVPAAAAPRKADSSEFCDSAAPIVDALQKPTTSVQSSKASALLKLLKADPGSIPSSLKSATKQLEGYLKPVAGAGTSLSKLAAAVKHTSKYNHGAAKFMTYYNTNCSSSATPSTGAASGGLSGTWSGKYSGASEGTFTLVWAQAGSSVTGTIEISDLPDSPITINGTLSGNSIKFGTVGSLAITYDGSVSGSTMSGTYSAPTGTGTWTASKTS